MKDTRLKSLTLWVGLIVALLWFLHGMQTAFAWPAYRLGIDPRTPMGLMGILTAPWIHGSWTHLALNTPALFVLLLLAIYRYPAASTIAIPAIYLLSGAGVWAFGRDSFHIGASGLTHGLMFFVFVSGVLRRDRSAMALSMLVFFLYGSMIWGIFPTQPGVSFEYHFFGAVSGVLLALLLRRRDPVEHKRYEWEEEREEDPVIGEEWRRDERDRGKD